MMAGSGPSGRLLVRPARAEDAPALAEMFNDLNEHVGMPGRPFTAERIRDASFGPAPALTAIVAELDGTLAGYAAFAPSYNTDIAARSVWLHDLFVVASARGHGVGHALMTAVAAETERLGGMALEWGVHVANTGAVEFYRRLGASDADIRIMSLDLEGLRALARGAPPGPGDPGGTGPRARGIAPGVPLPPLDQPGAGG